MGAIHVSGCVNPSHATSENSAPYLFEADDCHGGAGDHDEDAEDEEEVQDLVAQGAVREAPVRYLNYLNTLIENNNKLNYMYYILTTILIGQLTTNFLCLRY